MMKSQLHFRCAIGDEGRFMDDFPGDGRRIGWTPPDGAAVETLEMQSNNGLALAQWSIPQFEAALKNSVYLITLRRTSAKGPLNSGSQRFAFGRIVG